MFKLLQNNLNLGLLCAKMMSVQPTHFISVKNPGAL